MQQLSLAVGFLWMKEAVVDSGVQAMQLALRTTYERATTSMASASRSLEVAVVSAVALALVEPAVLSSSVEELQR